MLVSLSRSGPLRHRIVKGFIVAATDPAAVLDAIRFTSTDLGGCRLHCDERAPGAVWLDTGMVWLTDPQSRTLLRHRLAAGAAGLAGAVGAAGGRLVPGGWLGARGADTWLCADLHAVETVTDTQRELCTNLLRSWVPELIALTGHAAFGGTRTEREGSRRLADAGDHLSTRYLASAGPAHLSRVRDSLRRDEGVSRLELMDVNPIGTPDEVPNVVVRCVDAQILPATVVAQALLIQALAIRARQLERDGRRVPAGRQTLLDRNRSRAVSAGLAATFDEPDGPDRRHPAPRPASARERVLRLLEELAPQLQAMRVQADELAPIAYGLTVAGSQPAAVRSETDLLGRWAQHGDDLDRAEFFADAQWLGVDHLTAANAREHPGATALARAYWSERLQPTPARPREPAQAPAQRRDPAARDLLRSLSAENLTPGDVDRALTDYLRGGGPPDLIPALRGLPPEHAKTLRRTLRPARTRTRESAEMPGDWQSAEAADVHGLAVRDGRALLTVKSTADRREAALQAARSHLSRPPDGTAILLITNAVYRDPAGDQRSTIELLLVRTAEEGTP